MAERKGGDDQEGDPRITVKRLSEIRKNEHRRQEDPDEEESSELLLDDDEAQELRQVFSIFDKDGDGDISTKELGTVMHALGQNPTEAELFDIIEEIDKDGNGLIDFYEFAAMMKNLMKSVVTDDDLKEAFQLMNSSGSGFITHREIKLMIENLGQKITDKEVAAMISEVDQDGDGMISFDEFRALMRSTS